MAFTLRVEFAGLCLYVMHPDGQHVAVLMPDCRKSTNPNLVHLDGTDAEPHVGYVRLDMERLGLAIATPPGLEPRYELVHRFDRQVLKFDGAITASPINTGNLHYPSFDYMGFALDLVGNLFTATPPAVLLARMVLDGGDLVGTPIPNDWWEFPQVGNPSGPTYTSQFASNATWTRAMDGNTLTVRITDFADQEEAAFPMANIPEGSTVSIKVANLCCHNPLEWRDLTSRLVKGPDVDFKWLYKLLTPRGTSYPDLLNGTELPHPRLVAGPGGETGSDDCIAGTKVAGFPV
jgi:hypothetical protein